MIWNPWKRIKELEAACLQHYADADRLQAGNNALEHKLAEAQRGWASCRREAEDLRSRIAARDALIATMHRRDPKTGRILPKGK